MNISFHGAARKDLRELPADDARRVTSCIAELQKLAHPLQHHRVKKLRGDERYRLRVGDWRIKFVFKEPTAFVLRIEHRQSGY